MNSKSKGKRGEVELSHELRRLFNCEARRGVQYCGDTGAADVVGLEGVHAEVKRTEALSLYAAVDQAVGDAADGNIPVVFHRRSRREWVAIVRLDDLPELAKRLAVTQ